MQHKEFRDLLADYVQEISDPKNREVLTFWLFPFDIN